MKKINTVAEYFTHHSEKYDILILLRDIILETGLEETVKWGAPCYTFNKKNVVGLASFKSYVGLWFHQGALLKDKEKVLINAQEGTTKALRQWRIDSINDLDPEVIKYYIHEAIENEKKRKKVSIKRSANFSIPKELLDLLKGDVQLQVCYDAFSKFKQKEFCEYIKSAKRESTKLNRLEKIKLMILSSTGLNDKYRK